MNTGKTDSFRYIINQLKLHKFMVSGRDVSDTWSGQILWFWISNEIKLKSDINVSSSDVFVTISKNTVYKVFSV